jgi:hypothetical protein
MLKSLRDTAILAAAAIFCAAVASASVGIAPNPSNGPSLVDGTWLLGLAGGSNYTYQYGITALGTSQATAQALPANVSLIEVDTANSSTGVNLPFCYQGTALQVYNTGGNTITVYPAVANNPITAAQDTINNTTSTTISNHAAGSFFCAKNGNWASK